MRKYKVFEYTKFFSRAHNDVIEHCGGPEFLSEQEDLISILIAGWKELHRATLTRGKVTWDTFEFDDENALLVFVLKYGDRKK